MSALDGICEECGAPLGKHRIGGTAGYHPLPVKTPPLPTPQEFAEKVIAEASRYGTTISVLSEYQCELLANIIANNVAARDRALQKAGYDAATAKLRRHNRKLYGDAPQHLADWLNADNVRQS